MFGFNFAFAEEAKELADKIQELAEAQRQPSTTEDLSSEDQTKKEFTPKHYTRNPLPNVLEKFRTEFMTEFISSTNEVKGEIIKCLMCSISLKKEKEEKTMKEREEYIKKTRVASEETRKNLEPRFKQLVQIAKENDFYEILGVPPTCSVS